MKKYKLNKILQILFVFLFVFGIFMVFLGYKNIKLTTFNYKENSNIKYKVYLKPNRFFENNYLEENKTYIASLIDYIDIDFIYDAKFNQELNGDINYKYYVLVSANKKDKEGYYWQREYDLSDYKTIKMENAKVINIKDNFKIKYATYNNILSKFKKEFGLTTDGELKVLMKIENDSSIVGVEKPINIKTESSLSIPLLEKAIEISMNKDIPNTNKYIVFKDKDDSVKFTIYKISGFAIMILSIIAFIWITLKRIDYKKSNEYELELNRILANYDSIIANSKNIPPLDEYKRIVLNSFEELLDAYNEVRMPINYYQNDKDSRSSFFIIKNDVAWIYVLKKQ